MMSINTYSGYLYSVDLGGCGGRVWFVLDGSKVLPKLVSHCERHTPMVPNFAQTRKQ